MWVRFSGWRGAKEPDEREDEPRPAIKRWKACRRRCCLRFLSSLTDYAPIILDELVEHYLARRGFQCPDVGLVRLVAVATQKFVAEVASDPLQHCKARQTAVVKDKREKQQKDKRLILTMEAVSKALRKSGFPSMRVHPRSPTHDKAFIQGTSKPPSSGSVGWCECKASRILC